MRRWSVLILIGLFAIWVVVEIVHEFIANETVHYFTEQPRHLLYVIGIALLGGLSALIFDRLSPRAKRNLQLFAFGSGASGLTLLVGYFVFELLRLRLPPVFINDTRWLVLIPLSLAIVAALLWAEFNRVLKGKATGGRAEARGR